MKFFTRRAIYGVWFGCYNDIIMEAGPHPDTPSTKQKCLCFVGDTPEDK